MKPNIDFDECLKDSPKFRAALEENEHSIHDLESQLEKLAKVCSNVVDNGKTFTTSLGSLIGGFEALSPLFKRDDFVTNSLDRLCSVLSELQSFLLILLDQAQRSIVKGIQSFIKDDIKKAKETKKIFDKISDDLDSAYHKNGALLKTAKAVEVEEVENVLLATQSCFNHTALDYAFQINVLQSKRRFYILGQLVTFMNAQYAYFKQGTEVLNNIEPYLQELNSQLDDFQNEFQVDKKEMEERHTLVQRKRSIKHDNMDTFDPSAEVNNSNVTAEGYLFKRASNAFKTWNRRWFTVQNNKLYYQKRSKDIQTELIDLRLCTVKSAEDLERRFCFAIVCPTRCLYLQADSDRRKSKWIEGIQVFIAQAINSPISDVEDNGASSDEAGNPKPKRRINSFEKLHPQYQLQQIRLLPGNEKCADCNSSDPKWASVNIGIIVCIECSGIHRSLGVHISKVRSVTLDEWEPESLKLMSELGNIVINNIYEDGFDDTFTKPTPASARAEREAFIKAKYVEKRFVRVIKPRRSSKVKLRRKKPIRKTSGGRSKSFNEDSVSTLSDSPSRSTSLGPADQAGIPSHITDNDADVSLSSEEERLDEDLMHLPPNLLLYEATARKNLALMALALANGADVNFKNEEKNGMIALHEAAVTGCVASTEFLLQNGASLNVRDGQGRGVLHHAALYGNTALACLFLKRGANQQSVDENGEDALKIALKSCHADIVTLLRLARLNDEMRESDLSIASDETFTNVVRDFSNMATHNPEKLRRNFPRQTNV